MAGKNVHAMDNGAPLMATDEFYLTRSPYGIGDDRRISASKVAEFVGVASGVHGKLALGNGIGSGTVTGLGLPGVPTCVLLTVQSPVGGGVMAAALIGAPTTDGFAFALTGLTDSTTYTLHYALYL